MSKLVAIRKPVDKEMLAFENYFKNALSSTVPLLNFITNYILRRKGKQMRPLIVFLTAKLNGEINDSTFVAASLIELLHTATLVHDDVVDNSYQRRGFFSVKALWKSKIAVLVGDYLLAKGLMISVENNAYELLKIVSHAVRDMAEGELLQLEKARRLNITEDIYFEIIRKKTATLISSCCEAGSRSVTDDQGINQKMREFGLNLGITFQIKDDLFDYEEKNNIGKPKGNDIQEKKMTLPLIYSLNKTDWVNRRKVLQIIGKKRKSSSDIARVIEFVIKNGGYDYSVQKMTEYKELSLSFLDNYVDSEVKTALKYLIEYITVRKK